MWVGKKSRVGRGDEGCGKGARVKIVACVNEKEGESSEGMRDEGERSWSGGVEIKVGSGKGCKGDRKRGLGEGQKGGGEKREAVWWPWEDEEIGRKMRGRVERGEYNESGSFRNVCEYRIGESRGRKQVKSEERECSREKVREE
ncbi:hypothetical protein Tco_0568813 [Tanacetum coccineum]